MWPVRRKCPLWAGGLYAGRYHTEGGVIVGLAWEPTSRREDSSRTILLGPDTFNKMSLYQPLLYRLNRLNFLPN
jgi:hypothetical protein